MKQVIGQKAEDDPKNNVRAIIRFPENNKICIRECASWDKLREAYLRAVSLDGPLFSEIINFS